jgi:integrase
MGTVYKPTYTKPLPAHAELFTVKGQRVAKIKPEKGRTQTFPVAEGKDGMLRIVRTSKKYVAKFLDGTGKPQKVSTGCSDEGAARAVLHKHERRAELIRSGVMTVSEDAISDHYSAPLADHFDAYHEHRVARELSTVRIKNTDSRLACLADECGFRRLADLSADKLIQWLGKQKKAGMSPGTRNEYRQELVGFGNWCVQTHRISTNPFSDVPKANAKADPRRQRRSLTELQSEQLLLVAQLRPVAERGRKRRPVDAGESGKRSNWKLEPLAFETLKDAAERGRQALRDNPCHLRKLEQRGRERALVYRTFMTTGLRRGELASMTVGSIELDAPTPFARLAAKDEKNRKGSTIPLRPDLVAELREWIADKRENFSGTTAEFAAQPLFSVPKGLVNVLNRDLRVAGIPKVDERGRSLDIHAMRMTFGTMLSKGGVSPKVAQLAMRHSDIRLTMETYTDPKLLDIAGALDSLPALNPARESRSPNEPNGEEGQSDADADSWLVPRLVPNDANLGPEHSSADILAAEPEANDQQNEHAKTARNLRKKPDQKGFLTGLRGWRRRDSNPRPLHCERSALPTELRPLMIIAGV